MLDENYSILEIPDFIGYYADTEGIIWTTWKKGKNGGPYLGYKKQLKQNPDRDGYLTVALLNDKGKMIRKTVHRLILFTFKGEPPLDESGRLYEGCHDVGGRQDNRLINLSWGSKKVNNREDKMRDGTLLVGEELSWTELNEAKARVIWRALEFGAPQRFLAKIFNVSRGAIKAIGDGRSWAHMDHKHPLI